MDFYRILHTILEYTTYFKCTRNIYLNRQFLDYKTNICNCKMHSNILKLNRKSQISIISNKPWSKKS